MDIRRKPVRMADAVLLSVALIWGAGFIATEMALRAGMRPAWILSLRFSLAALILLPFQWKRLRALPRRGWGIGVSAGALLCLGFWLQTLGQERTSVSNCAFLTAANVVMVPFAVWAVTRKSPRRRVYVLAFCTLAGIGILTLRGDAGSSHGDALVLLCALMFALHITFLGSFAGGLDAGALTALQMLTAAALSIMGMLALGRGEAAAVPWREGLLPVLYLAAFSTCLCFAAQTWAQQRTPPAKAAILLSTEGLFGSLCSVVMGMEPLTWNLAVGGLIIVTCVILTEVEPPCWKKRGWHI